MLAIIYIFFMLLKIEIIFNMLQRVFRASRGPPKFVYEGRRGFHRPKYQCVGITALLLMHYTSLYGSL